MHLKSLATLHALAPLWARWRRRLSSAFDRVVLLIPDWVLWPGLWLTSWQRKRPIRILFGVHAFHPDIGGCEIQVGWMAAALREKGYRCYVYAPRHLGQARRVNGIPVVVSLWLAKHCDVVFTYSANAAQQALGAYVASLKDRPRYLHFPCSMFPGGQELIRYADKILAKTPKDIRVTEAVCGSRQKVIEIVHAAHESRRGQQGAFRHKFGIAEDYILWVGAWLPAKGVRNLSERFTTFRSRQPARALKLVMFGGYGDSEYPIEHPDIIRIDRNFEDVPSALADCLFVAFNSPPAPIGFDANPTIIFEAILNGKTFVAQDGTPILEAIGQLGLVVTTDEEWLSAVETLVSDDRRRGELEAACRGAYAEKLNYSNLMAEVESAIRNLVSSTHP